MRSSRRCRFLLHPRMSRLRRGPRHDHGVGSSTTRKHIVAVAAVQRVGSVVPEERLGTGRPGQGIRRAPSADPFDAGLHVIAFAGPAIVRRPVERDRDGGLARCIVDYVVTVAAGELVGAIRRRRGNELVVSRAAGHDIVARSSFEPVRRSVAGKRVGLTASYEVLDPGRHVVVLPLLAVVALRIEGYGHRSGACCVRHCVRTDSPKEDVRAVGGRTPKQLIVTLSPVHGVAPRSAVDRVVATVTAECVPERGAGRSRLRPGLRLCSLHPRRHCRFRRRLHHSENRRATRTPRSSALSS